MLEITTAAEDIATTDDGEGTPFTIDGREFRYYEPSDGQVVLLMTATATGSSQQEQIAGIINFLASVVDDEALAYIRGRLFDRRDKFGIAHVSRLLEGMVEGWTGRPTVSPSASTTSQQNTGPSSTPPTPVLT